MRWIVGMKMESMIICGLEMDEGCIPFKKRD